MLILNPRQATFGSVPWPNITLIAIDRRSTRLAIAWSDNGPHPTFADAPEQQTLVQVLMDVEREDIDAPRPGDQGELTFTASPTATDASRRRVSMTAVITNVTHELSLKRGSIRTVSLIAISTNGAADPITITDAAGE
jgi:hypothetical protein